MKRLYARFVLWLIRPAIELDAERRWRALFAGLAKARPNRISAITEDLGAHKGGVH